MDARQGWLRQWRQSTLLWHRCGQNMEAKIVRTLQVPTQKLDPWYKFQVMEVGDFAHVYAGDARGPKTGFKATCDAIVTLKQSALKIHIEDSKAALTSNTTKDSVSLLDVFEMRYMGRDNPCALVRVLSYLPEDDAFADEALLRAFNMFSDLTGFPSALWDIGFTGIPSLGKFVLAQHFESFYEVAGAVIFQNNVIAIPHENRVRFMQGSMSDVKSLVSVKDSCSTATATRRKSVAQNGVLIRDYDRASLFASNMLWEYNYQPKYAHLKRDSLVVRFIAMCRILKKWDAACLMHFHGEYACMFENKNSAGFECDVPMFNDDENSGVEGIAHWSGGSSHASSS